MNKKGQFDITELMESPVPIILACIGAGIAYFTSIGGFNQSANFNPGLLTKVFATLIGGVVGFVWGIMMQNR